MAYDFDIPGISSSEDAETPRILNVMAVDNTPALNRDGSPITIGLKGVDSEAYKKQARANMTARLSRDPGKLTAEELDAEALGLIIAVSVMWTVKGKDGKPIPLTPASAKAPYLRYPDIREQADRYIHNRGNYISGSSPT